MKNMRIALALAMFAVAASSIWASGKPEELSPGLYAEITTSKGAMTFRLDYENAPLTVANFVGLAKGIIANTYRPEGVPFYDGMEVYHLAPRYAVFIGDPVGDGSGGPGYTIPRETSGSISTASPGALVMDGFATESAGSRFFITVAGDEFLDSKYTAFGEVVSGASVVRRLKAGDAVETVQILQIGEEAEGLTLNQDIFDALVAKGRENEISNLEAVDPALAEAVRSLGEDRIKTSTGIYYSVLSEGSGEPAKTGNQISMHYTGFLLDGTVFDSSRPRGQTFDFVLGRDGIIPGWIEMVIGMKPGEVRQVVIPPGMAYGEMGFGPIEPNSWLVFEMELVGVAEG